MADTVKEAAPQQVEFRAEIQQLLDILIHSLYSNQEIFLRELLSNASDALNRVKFETLTNRNLLDEKAELGIWIETDEETRTLTIRDTGIGMNEEEIVQGLGTIAHSGAKEFLKAMEEAGKKEQGVTTDVIGQFGVGFYSVFMVAEEVTVTSRSFRPDDTAVAWTSTGQGTYSVSPAERAERGTIIHIKLKEEAKDYARNYKIRQVVKAHSDFVAFPIYLKEEKPPADDSDKDTAEKTFEWNQINEQTAIWRQSPREVDEEKYKSFYHQFTFDFGDPLLRIHTSADAPVQFYALLFVPSKKDYRMFGGKDDFGLKLYSRKVLIKENFKDLLPNYLRFIEGVVDSEDIPLNVSREMVQATPLLKKIGKTLVRRIASQLGDLAADEPEKYATFWQEFGAFIKEGIATDPDSKARFTDLLRFTSSTGGADELVSLKQYTERMKDDQTEIYYILGDDYGVLSRSPHLEYFRKHEIEVLFLTDPLDSFMLMGLTEYDGKPLKNVDDAGLDLPETESADEETEAAETISADAFETLVARFKSVLGDRVEDVRESKILTDSPARLVNPADALNANMQRVQRLLGQDYQIPKKILEINRRNGLVQNLSARLAANSDDPLVTLLIEQLYANELVTEGIHPNPAEMVSRIYELMDAAGGNLPK